MVRHRGVLVAAVTIVAVIGLFNHPTTAQVAPRPLVLQRDAIIFGEEGNAFVDLRLGGDLSGDGMSELWIERVSYGSDMRSWQPIEEIILGRAVWPPAAGVSQLGAVVTPRCRWAAVECEGEANCVDCRAVLDANGDGHDDLLVERTANNGRLVEVLFYYSPRAAHGVDVDTDPPDFVVRQPRFDRTSNVLAWLDEIVSGDFDGDGRPDLAVGSSNLYGRRYHGALPAGMVGLYFDAAGTRQSIDLSEDVPDARIYGMATDMLGTTVLAADLNRDGLDDLVFTQSNHMAGDYHKHDVQVTIVFGRSDWAPANELEDIRGAQFPSPDRAKRVRPHLVADLNGDGARDLLVVYLDERYEIETEALWFSGDAFQAEEPFESADVRLTGTIHPTTGWHGSATIGDVSGDGINDLLVYWPRSTETDPEVGHIFLGPLRGPELQIGPGGDEGDYTFALPGYSQPNDGNGDAWLTDVNGDDVVDLVVNHSPADSPSGIEHAGIIELFLGPVVARGLVPGPSATAPPTSATPATVTPTDIVGETGTPPTAGGTATETPTGTTSPTVVPWRAAIHLPALRRGVR